jgi:toxin CcdB
LISQFDVVANKADKRGYIPFFLVLQHHFLEAATTVVVAPLFRDPNIERLPARLSPEISVAGRKHYCAVHLLAAVPRNALGKPVANAIDHRDAIIRAYDIIISGI